MIELPFGGNSFRTIYADPPWHEQGEGSKGGKRGADHHYSIMKTQDIVAMGVEVDRVAQETAHLYLWVTNNFLKDGLQVMEAWGFRYLTLITWMKDRQGLGQYYRGMTEHCLFGTKGFVPYKVTGGGKRLQGQTGFAARRGKHSEKPHTMRQMIQKVSTGPFLELFARSACPGWETWGNDDSHEYVGQVPMSLQGE